jgi:hypothetical protein
MGRYSEDKSEPSYADLIGPALMELAKSEIDAFSAKEGRPPTAIRMTEKERYAAMGTAFRGTSIGYEQNGQGFSLIWGVPVVVDEQDSLLSRARQ